MSSTAMAKKAKKAAGKKGGGRAAVGEAGPVDAAGAPPSRGADECVALAESLVEECRPQEASLLYEEALMARPADPAIMDALGALLYEMGDEARARDLFQASAKVSPAGGHSKWLHLAQLAEGPTAVEAFRRGIALLEAKVAGTADPAEAAVLRRELSNAYCGVADVYLTDLCDEAEAEGVSEASAGSAVKVDPSNPEAYAVAASVRLSQSRPADAAALLKKACEALSALEEQHAAAQDEEDETTVSAAAASAAAAASSSSSSSSSAASHPAAPFPLPTYSARLSLARMCLEVELNDEAGELLDTLLGEDDTDMEVWFLAAEAKYHSGELDDASELVATAHAMVSAAMSAMEAAGRGRKGTVPKASAAASAAAAAAPVPFTQGAMESLLDTSVAELRGQLEQFSKLGSVIGAAIAAEVRSGAGAGAGGSSAKGGMGDEDEDEEEDEEDGDAGMGGR
jgi:tetratricopeptide (TPR) repeat protein